MINEYGDVPQILNGKNGYDISSQRLDDLDKTCLEFAKTLQLPFGSLDIGAGLCTQGILLAKAGADSLCIDLHNEPSTIQQARADEADIKLSYIKGDIRTIDFQDVLPSNLYITYSQRTLHYLPYRDIVKITSALTLHMANEGKLFISFSGLDSELGNDYEDFNKPIDKRFTTLSPIMQHKHDIHAPVCLFRLQDIEKLADDTGTAIDTAWQSSFGNVKAILSLASSQI